MTLLNRLASMRRGSIRSSYSGLTSAHRSNLGCLTDESSLCGTGPRLEVIATNRIVREAPSRLPPEYPRETSYSARMR